MKAKQCSKCGHWKVYTDNNGVMKDDDQVFPVQILPYNKRYYLCDWCREIEEFKEMN